MSAPLDRSGKKLDIPVQHMHAGLLYERQENETGKLIPGRSICEVRKTKVCGCTITCDNITYYNYLNMPYKLNYAYTRIQGY